MWRDVRDAVRALRRTPVVTLAATLVLGLAIGANATMFSLIDGLWLRPPGVEAPGAIVRIYATTETERYGLWSFPEYADLRDRTSAFSGVAAIGRRGAMLDDASGSPELLLANVVSLDFFTTLGVRAADGRLFAPGDASVLDAEPAPTLEKLSALRNFPRTPSQRFHGPSAQTAQDVRHASRLPQLMRGRRRNAGRSRRMGDSRSIPA